MDSGMIIYGISDSMKAIEQKSIETIICYENLDWLRVTRKNKETGIEDAIYIPPNE